MKERIRIGTRGSELALAQTNQVIAAIEKRFPEMEVERVILRTKGDKILDKPLLEFGGKGVFVTEFEEALKEKRIDFAVHSAKDMPMELGDGLVIAGVLPRADARDVLVTRKDVLFSKELVIGTGSLRRQFQLRRIYSQAICKSIRGNVPTRLEKLRHGEYDGVVLAAAGLERLGLLKEEDLEYRFFSYDEMVPAGGQGIIAIEGRKEDVLTKMIQEISSQAAYNELMAERKILRHLNAGCHEAIGTIAQYDKEVVQIHFIQEKKGQITRMNETVRAEDGLELAGRMAERCICENRG